MAEIPTTGQMLWKLEGDDRVLHLRLSSSDEWRYYEEFPEYALPDPPEFSKGIRTFLTLRKQNWSVELS